MIVSQTSANSYKQVYTALLISITLEEAGLWHIINAEGEKIQAIGHGIVTGKYNLDDAILLQSSVNKVIQVATKSQMLLENKLKTILDVMTDLDKTMNR